MSLPSIPQSFSRYQLAIVLTLAIAFLSVLSTGWVGAVSWALLGSALVAAVIAAVGIQEGKFPGSISRSTLVSYVIGAAIVILTQLASAPKDTALVGIFALLAGFEHLAEDLGIPMPSLAGATTPSTATGPPSKP